MITILERDGDIEMKMSNIIDDCKNTNKIKNVYKYIEKHENEITYMFNNIYNDLSSVLSDVFIDDRKETITISITTVEDDSTDEMNSTFSMVNDFIHRHIHNTLGDDKDYLIPYILTVEFNSEYKKIKISIRR